MATNLPPKNNDSVSTGEFFSAYNTPRAETVVDPNEFEAIRGFFLKKTDNSETVANGLTDTVIQIANLHDVSPMNLIEDFTDYGISDIQQALVSLINQTRANTSILGFNKTNAPSTYFARNILY
ncbi:MAG: hypothetical protein CMC82_00040 [Flavobacteriaceae bacterium]|nr:hypothetical protein [Flavobacteriaceae bacterium]|tara:strand:+ start:766 stop:1137 length:372 start_codon:yes stop_codon:yes gene_type:complete